MRNNRRYTAKKIAALLLALQLASVPAALAAAGGESPAPGTGQEETALESSLSSLVGEEPVSSQPMEEAPAESQAPQATPSSEATPAPESTESPEGTGSPESTESPESSPAPEGTPAPTQEPE